MILRRVMDHVRAQNWTAIGLDFLIVVLGVFIGIQVSNLNEARKDRALADNYLDRIHADLTSDLDKYDMSDAFAGQRMKQVAILTEAVENPSEVAAKPKTFLEAMEKATWRSYEPVEPAAFAELISSGLTTLIRPVELREEIALYYSLIERWAEIVEDRKAQQKFTAATAGMLDAHQLEAIELDEEDGAPMGNGIQPERAVAVAQALSLSPEAARWLPHIHKHQVLVKQVNAAHRKRARSLIEKIEKYRPILKKDAEG